MIDVDVAGKRGDFDYAVRFKSSENVTALFGVSGAGKTTMVEVLSGDVRPDNGYVIVNDTPFFDTVANKNMPVRRRRVGHIFQDARLFPHLTVKRNLTYARWAGRRSHKGAEFDDVVALLGLGDLLKRFPNTLSGGERQRVAIGRALLSDPRLLLMDEPLSGLDYQRKSEIMPYLESLAHEGGVPIVYVSHDLDEVVRLAGHVVLMENGRVAKDGLTADILPQIHGQFDFARHAPNSLLKAHFDEIDYAYQMTWLSFGQQKLLVPGKLAHRKEPYRIRIDASDVALSLVEPEQSSFQNILSGRVHAIQHHGKTTTDVVVSIDGQTLTARVSRKASSKLRLQVEKSVYVLVKSLAVDGIM